MRPAEPVRRMRMVTTSATTRSTHAWDAIARDRESFRQWIDHERAASRCVGRRNRFVSYTATEMMTVEAARALRNEDICFVGIGLPSAACNLARLTHAPRLTLVYESGTLETKPHVLPLSIGDGELSETALSTVPVPEMFQYWLQGGRISVGFLGGAQVDRYGNLNSTVVGDYTHPEVRLPGSGGATEIATALRAHIHRDAARRAVIRRASSIF